MSRRIELFGIRIDAMRLREAVTKLSQWLDEEQRSCRYVVTPNVDHVVMFQERADLRAVYREASMVLADGAPVVWSSRLLGKPVPERVAGSDLTPAIFQSMVATRKLRTFLLGAGPGVAERAADNIHKQWPGVEVVGCYSPPMGFERNEAENAKIIQLVNEADTELLVVGLGAPKQELWIHKHARQLRVRVALCVGATIDFLAGEKPRAPRWMQKVGLEWLHRVASEPRRLFKRYARDAMIFPQLVWRQWRSPKAFAGLRRWK